MNIEGKNLFPIHSALPELRHQYYMQADGAVFSNSRGKLVRLLGSMGVRGGITFTFQTARGYSKSVTHTYDELKHRCMNHPSFRSHTQDQIMHSKGTAVKAKTEAHRHHAESTESGIKAKGSIIGRVHKGHLVFGSEPKIHMTEDSVKSEMQRLALEHPGVKFVELKIGKSVVAGGVTWE